MIKVSYLTGTRADFGLMKLILETIVKDQDFRLSLFATGMHLLDQFGKTINEVKKAFPKTRIIDATYQEDSRLAMALFAGKCLKKIAGSFAKANPDVTLVLGDRAEQLASATASVYLNIPLIHLHGGETSGTVDNPVRHAISSLASFHCVTTKKSARNLSHQGIEVEKIFVVGAPGVEEIKKLPRVRKKRQILVLQHPAENETRTAKQMEITLKAVAYFKLPTVVIYPNADAGGRTMIKVINKIAAQSPLVKTYPSLARQKFLKVMAESSLLVGNSSAALIEAPSLHLPAVNIGERQKERERTKNVIDSGYNIEQIKEAINKALNQDFQKALKKIKNPYDGGQTSQKVLNLIKNLHKNGKI